jgi:LPXTG-motif cell wall-anchored protein
MRMRLGTAVLGAGMVLTLVGALGGPLVGAVTVDNPQEFDGNVTTCAQVGLGGSTQYEGNITTGVTDMGPFTATIVNNRYVTLSDFAVGLVFQAVVVKGGDGYHVYNPPVASMESPLNNGGNVPELSHWFVCYTYNPPTSTTAAPTTAAPTTAAPTTAAPTTAAPTTAAPTTAAPTTAAPTTAAPTTAAPTTAAPTTAAPTTAAPTTAAPTTAAPTTAAPTTAAPTTAAPTTAAPTTAAPTTALDTTTTEVDSEGPTTTTTLVDSEGPTTTTTVQVSATTTTLLGSGGPTTSQNFSLPTTGQTSPQLVVLGLFMVLLGGAMQLVTRRPLSN